MATKKNKKDETTSKAVVDQVVTDYLKYVEETTRTRFMPPDMPPINAMNQRQFLSQFNQFYKEQFNPDLFVRSDDEVMDQLQKVIKSCERHNNYFSIEVEKFRVVDDYDQIKKIMFNYYEYLARNKTKTKKRDNPYEYINMNQSDIRLLIVTYHVAVNLENNLSIRPEDLAAGKVVSEESFDVYICVPRVIDKYYFRINGIVRSTLYQIVDGSTYNNNYTNSKIPNISFKIIFMAARVFRYTIGLFDMMTGEEIKLLNYRANIFNKTVCVDKYFLAKMGFEGTMKFLGIHGVAVSNKPCLDESVYCFEKEEGKLYVIADKYLTDNDPVTQGFITCIFTNLIPGMDYRLVFKKEFWIRTLGGEFNRCGNDKYLAMFAGDPAVTDTYNKGMSILDSFENVYDIATKEDLRLKDESKEDMYSVLRWIMREFVELKKKDNYDVGIKRIRFGQYVAATYIYKVARGINRVSDQNNRITVESIKRAIRTDPMYLLKAISKSNLVSYRNIVSDMDSLLALKFSLKGISGIGEDDNNSIPESIRFVHPSHVGRIDLDASSDNNPGVTGLISPFNHMTDGYFTDYEEPDTWEEKYRDLYDDYIKANGELQLFDAKGKLLNIKGSETKAKTLKEKAVACQKILFTAMEAVEPGIYYYPFRQVGGMPYGV